MATRWALISWGDDARPQKRGAPDQQGRGEELKGGTAVPGHWPSGAWHAPENTIAAFDRALAMGVDGAETTSGQRVTGCSSCSTMLPWIAPPEAAGQSPILPGRSWRGWTRRPLCRRRSPLRRPAHPPPGHLPRPVWRADVVLAEIKARGWRSCRPPGTGARGWIETAVFTSLPAWGDNGRAV